MTRNNADFHGGKEAQSWLESPDDYVTLYRGIRHHGPRELPSSPNDFKNLGMHWTTSFQVAGSFAVNHQAPGHIITAKIHKNDIITRGSSEWHDLAQDHAIEGAYDDEPRGEDEYDEKEMTVREGARTHILRVTPVNHFDEEAPESLHGGGVDWRRFTAPSNGTDFHAFLTDKSAVNKTYLKKGQGTA